MISSLKVFNHHLTMKMNRSHHFSNILDDMLECEPSENGVGLSLTFSQIVADAKNIVIPNADQIPLQLFKYLNIEDPQSPKAVQRRKQAKNH
ncbi:hypothetical protein CEXT_111121 [Caerostris extrusa]|uniref:Uncharacterized protein n=1 Tax=Caerostris extrusa TaxID=172846 RepID=A0AAV4MWT7_CAEEX|nr:hypothetical protein CEXT_111121 [Caerostris extrusa]